MKVILKQDVKNLGKAGQVIDVADGYARNYLIPRGLAVEASDANLRQLQEQQRQESRRAQQARAQAEADARKLDGQTVRLTARAGEGGRLYGSVTPADVAEALAALAGHPLDRRKIELAEPIRQVGRYQVVVRLHPEVSARVYVEVVAES